MNVTAKFTITGISVVLGVSILLWQYSASHQTKQAEPSGSAITYSADNSHKKSDSVLAIDRLKQQLKTEITLRKSLEKRISELEQQINQQRQLSDQSLNADSGKSTSTARQTLNKNSSIDLEASLTQLGMDKETIALIRQRYGNNRMSLLEIRHRASREGWLGTDRYNEEISHYINPGEDIRQELGDQVYDDFLYAYGKPNRVKILDVYPDSVAEISGLRPDDIVLSYASNNIFTINDLRQATIQGSPGEQILIEVQRNNSLQYIYVARGPLGIEMQAISQLPNHSTN